MVWVPSINANSNLNPATALIINQVRAAKSDHMMRCINSLTTGSIALKQSE
ncbi:MAG: hypothetical protein RL642_432 [Bacteroidota bacterium]